MKKMVSLAIFLSFLCVSEAWAVPDICAGSPDEQSLYDCRKNEQRTALEKLNRLVNEIKRSYAGEREQLRLFIKSQAAWMSWSQDECKFSTYESSSGTAGEIYLISCISQNLNDRISVLEKLRATP